MKTQPPAIWEGLPVVDAAGMRALDHSASEKFGIPPLTLMENAGKAVADECVNFLREHGKVVGGARIVVCCGRGANGGDGLVTARYLRMAGAHVSVFMCPPKKEGAAGGHYPNLVQKNLDAAKAAGVEIKLAGPDAGLAQTLGSCDLAVDALLGTGSNGKPAGAIHHMIQELTRSKKPVIAIDVPSGIHPDTGYHSGVFVSAELTLMLGLPKRGLLAAHAQKSVGRLKVVDIGYPMVLLKEGNRATPR